MYAAALVADVYNHTLNTLTCKSGCFVLLDLFKQLNSTQDITTTHGIITIIKKVLLLLSLVLLLLLPLNQYTITTTHIVDFGGFDSSTILISRSR